MSSSPSARTSAQAATAAELAAAINAFVDEYRRRCLWSLRQDYYPRTPAEQLRVLEASDIEVTWEDESRLHSIELRTGRSQWERASLGAPNGTVEQALMTLGLDYDINGVASVALDVHVVWDPTLARIALRFGKEERRTEHWVAIADNAFVDVDDAQMLREIRFANVALISDEPS